MISATGIGLLLLAISCAGALLLQDRHGIDATCRRTELERRGECNGLQCTGQAEYLNEYTCKCDTCAYTSDHNFNNSNYICECYIKSKKCQTGGGKYSRWSAWGRKSREYPEPGTPPNRVCLPQTTDAPPTDEPPTVEPSTDEPSTVTPSTESPQHARSSEAPTTEPNKPSQFQWTPKVIAVVAVVGGIVIAFIGTTMVFLYKRWKKNRFGANPSMITTCHEQEAGRPLIPPTPTNTPTPTPTEEVVVNITSRPDISQHGHQITGVAVDTQVNEHGQVDVVIPKQVAPIGNASANNSDNESRPMDEVLNTNDVEMTNLNPHDDTASTNTIDSERKLDSCDVTLHGQDVGDSGIESGMSAQPSVDSTPKQRYSPDSQPSPRCTPRDIVGPLSHVCAKLVDNVAAHGNQSFTDSGVGDLGAAAGAAALPNELQSSNQAPGVPSQDSLIASLKLMKGLRRLQPTQPTKREKWSSTIEKVMKIFDPNSIPTSCATKKPRNSVTSFTTEECNTIGELVAMIERHDDFPKEHSAVQENIATVKDILKGTGNMNMQLQIEELKQQLEQHTEEQNSIKANQRNQEEKITAHDTQITAVTAKLETQEERLHDLKMKASASDFPEEVSHLAVGCLKNMAFTLINPIKYHWVKTCSFQLLCHHKGCDGNCFDARGYVTKVSGIPLAHFLPTLKEIHCYKLVIRFEGPERSDEKSIAFNTTGSTCKEIFGALHSDMKAADKISKYLDTEGKGEWVRQLLAQLMDCVPEHKHYKFKGRGVKDYSVIQKLLEINPEWPVSVLFICLRHFKMQDAIDELAEWHQNCPVCRDLYRGNQVGHRESYKVIEHEEATVSEV